MIAMSCASKKSFVIEVSPAGVPLSLGLEVFEVRRAVVRMMMQEDLLGTPRDYVAPRGAVELWFTPVGLRNLAALLGHEAVVVAKGGRA